MVEKVYRFPKNVKKWLFSPTSKIVGYRIRNKNIEIIGQKAPFIKKEIFKIIPTKGRNVKKIRTAFGDIVLGKIRVEWNEKIKKVI